MGYQQSSYRQHQPSPQISSRRARPYCEMNVQFKEMRVVVDHAKLVKHRHSTNYVLSGSMSANA